MNRTQLWRIFSLCILAALTTSTPARGQNSFAYVVNNFETADSSSSALWMYRVDRSTGLLTPNGSIPFGVGESPLSLASDPHNRFLYIANSFSISGYSIDPIAGTLSPLPSSPFSAPTPWAVAVHPSGKFLYAAGGTSGVALYSLDAAGISTFITRTAAVNGGATALTIDPSGRFLYTAELTANTASFYTIDKNSGTLTLAGQVSTGPLPGSVALTPSGNFLFVPNENGQSVSVYSIDSSSGVPTPVPGSPFATGLVPRAAVVTPSGSFVYIVESGHSTISAFTGVYYR